MKHETRNLISFDFVCRTLASLSRHPDPTPHPSDWSELFTAFVIDFRNDLDESNLPVVFTQIGSTWSPEAFSNWDLVKDQQASMQLSTSAMIITDDLLLLDGVHFKADTYSIIGMRFADAIWELSE